MNKFAFFFQQNPNRNNNHHHHQSLIPLGGVGYMDQTMSLGFIRN